MPIAPERCQLVFQKLEQDLDKLAAKPEAKKVHRFRTDARRLQTLLEELAPSRDRNQKKLLKLLIRLRKRAGKVRDLDVQLAALHSLKMPQEPRRKTQLTQELIELRTRQETKLSKTLTKEVVRDLRKRLKRAHKEFNPGTINDPLSVAKQILEPVTKAAPSLTEDLLHQYRILGKRARYAAEFAPKSPQSVEFIAQLKRAQDALGDWHDWLILTQTAAKNLGEVRESSLVAALHNVTGAKFRNAVTALSASRTRLPSSKTMPSGQRNLRKKQSSTTGSAARSYTAA